jgi:hypothetical protein
MSGRDAAAPAILADEAARSAFDLWLTRLHRLGITVDRAGPDGDLVALVATRQARLEALASELARERDPDRRLRIGSAERLAAGDYARALDLVERAFGSRVEVAAEEPDQLRATGTDDGNVLAFQAPGVRSKAAQRIVAVVAKAGAPLSLAQLRRRVPGSQGDWRRGLREAVDAGAVARSGRGHKGSPFLYSRGEATDERLRHGAP